MRRKTGSLPFVLVVALVTAFLSASPAPLEAAPKRHRVIEFDDELVEGMNKRPLDSLSQIGERDRRDPRPHLYRKRAGFRQEAQQTLREMRYSP